MPTVKKITVYKFRELSEQAKEKALEKLYNINTDYDWFDTEFYDAKEIGKLMGIDIKDIHFTGFSSQGDGACFTGNYQYKKGSVKAVKDYAPLDIRLHNIAEGLAAVQRKFLYGISANVKHRGHYSHKYCTDINITITQNGYEIAYSSDDETIISELLRDFMDRIYRQLEKQYEYLTSKKAIQETIEINNYEFTADGAIFIQK